MQRDYLVLVSKDTHPDRLDEAWSKAMNPTEREIPNPKEEAWWRLRMKILLKL